MADESRYAQWESELSHTRKRISGMREILSERLTQSAGGGRFDFIRDKFGMFFFLRIEPEQLVRLREEFGIYMIDSTRINAAGLNRNNVDYFADYLLAVLRSSSCFQHYQCLSQ